MSNKRKQRKGECEMNAYATKPNVPFITKGELGRTPATNENRKMVEFMDSHDFSFSVNNKTKELKSIVTLKKT